MARVVVEDIVFVKSAQDDTEAALTQLAFVPHSSLVRYPLFSPGVAGRIYNPFIMAYQYKKLIILTNRCTYNLL